MNFILLYIPTPDKELATQMAKTLVEEKLVACANIVDSLRSIYFWDGRLQDDQECLLLAKTAEHLFEKVQKRVEDLHPYSCPCIVSLPLSKGNPAYLHWLKENLLSMSEPPKKD